MVSPTMTEDVDDQLGISAFSSCSPAVRQLNSSDLSGPGLSPERPSWDAMVGCTAKTPHQLEGVTLGWSRAAVQPLRVD
jgi:hypothetical protein